MWGDFRLSPRHTAQAGRSLVTIQNFSTFIFRLQPCNFQFSFHHIYQTRPRVWVTANLLTENPCYVTGANDVETGVGKPTIGIARLMSGVGARA